MERVAQGTGLAPRNGPPQFLSSPGRLIPMINRPLAGSAPGEPIATSETSTALFKARAGPVKNALLHR